MNNSIFKTFFLSLCIIANTSFAYAQTASILPPAKTQFLDNNGKPLTSGTVDFYIPSTSTRKTTWQNSTETIANTNPVVLDAGGRAIIYGDGTYRQVVKDRLGNTIWDQVTSSTGSGSTPSTSTGDGDLVGTIKPWAGMTAPNQYAFTYGQELSRTTYAALYTAITSTQPVFCNSGSPTLAGLSDTTNFWIGMSLEVSCIAAGHSTVISKTASTVTMASNANVTANTSAIFYPWGRGNGSTTFNLPDFRGQTIAGNNNMGGVANNALTTAYFGATNPNSIGAYGGLQYTQLVPANIPNYSPIFVGTPATATSSINNFVSGTLTTITPTGGGATQYEVLVNPTGNSSSVFSSITATGTIADNGGSSTLFSNVQPTKTTNYIIKIVPDTNSSTASGVTDIQGMTGSIGCGANLTCTGNIINAITTSSDFYVLANNFAGADIGAQINAAIASLPLPGGTVAISPGYYSGVATQIVIDKRINLIGNGSKISFNAGVGGLKCTGANAAYSTVDNVELLGSDVGVGSNSGFTIQCPYFYGSQLRASGFGAHSLAVLSLAASSPPGEIADNWYVTNSLFRASYLDNIHAEGNDSNKGTCLNCQVQGYTRYGVYDNTVGGNQYINFNFDGTGTSASGGISSTTAGRILSPSIVIDNAYCEVSSDTITFIGAYNKYNGSGSAPCSIVNITGNALSNQITRYNASGYPSAVGWNMVSPETDVTQQSWGWRWNDSTKQIQLMDWNTNASIMDYNPAILALDIPNLTRLSQLTVFSTFKIGATTQNFPASGNLVGTTDAQALTNKSYNGNTWTAGTGTLTIGAGKTLTSSNTITIAGTDGSTLDVGTGGALGTAAFLNTGTSGATVARLDGANNWTNGASFGGNNTVGIGGTGTTPTYVTMNGASGSAGGSSTLFKKNSTFTWSLGEVSARAGSSSVDFELYNYTAPAAAAWTVNSADNSMSIRKIRTTGTAPALTSCGTSPAISGSDTAGEVTMGTGSPTGCVITFNAAYTSAPYCTVSWQATPLASQSYTVSTTAITTTQTATSSNKLNYTCFARSGG